MDLAARRPVVGTRLTVWMTIGTGLLSIATGIVNISTPIVFAPLAVYVPFAAERTAGFTGTLTGFLLLACAFGLRRGLRLALGATLLLLVLAVGQGLLQSSALSFPLVVLALLDFALLVYIRRRFDRPVSFTTSQAAATGALFGVLCYGTVGAYALRAQFVGVESPLDAVYFTVITASTVGYGDVTATTQGARLFALSVVLLGTSSFGLALAVLLRPALQTSLTRALGRMTRTQLEQLEDHVVVLGYGDLTEPILNELDDLAVTVVVAPDPDVADRLDRAGYRTLVDDPSDEETLERVHLDTARAVVAATNDDADDALVVLTARQHNPDVTIVAAASDQENVAKLKRAGANTVISPAALGSHLIALSAIGQRGMEALAAEVLERTERPGESGQ